MGDAPSDRRHLLEAFLLAPLTAPVAYGLALVVIEFYQSAKHGTNLPNVAGLASIVGLVGLVGTPIAYASAALGGLPVYLLLRRAGLVSRWILLAVGASIGFAVAIIIQPHVRGEMISIPFPLWAGAVLGLVSAEVFWRRL